VEISLCGLAILGVVVDAATSHDVSLGELYQSIRPHPRVDELPGRIETWPHDVSEWTDELQLLIDRGFVIRVPRDTEYRFRPTTEGIKLVHGNVHPIAAHQHRRSVA